MIPPDAKESMDRNKIGLKGNMHFFLFLQHQNRLIYSDIPNDNDHRHSNLIFVFATNL